MAAGDAGAAVWEVRRGSALPVAPPATSAAGLDRRLVVVSNRVGPVDPGKVTEGGLAVVLRAALAQAGGIWFGFSGTVAETPSGAPSVAQAGNITFATLDLSRQDFDEYYIGFANRVP